MSVFFRITVVLAAGFGLLFGDLAWSIPVSAPTRAQITEDAGTQIARRRKRRRKRKPTPKPTPAPEPEPAMEPGGAPAAGGAAGLGRSNRIEFDAQLIKGQTTKAGEVQILERKDTELKSMVKRRTSFREEIIHTVFPDK